MPKANRRSYSCLSVVSYIPLRHRLDEHLCFPGRVPDTYLGHIWYNVSGNLMPFEYLTGLHGQAFEEQRLEVSLSHGRCWFRTNTSRGRCARVVAGKEKSKYRGYRRVILDI